MLPSRICRLRISSLRHPSSLVPRCRKFQASFWPQFPRHKHSFESGSSIPSPRPRSRRPLGTSADSGDSAAGSSPPPPASSGTPPKHSPSAEQRSRHAHSAYLAARAVLVQKLLPHEKNDLNFKTLEYPHLEHVRKILLSKTRAALSGYEKRNIILSCPHPGAVSYLEDTVQAIAGETQADFLSLDYLSFLDFAHKVDQAHGGSGIFSIREPDLNMPVQFSESFSPGLYEPYDSRSREDDDADEENDEEEEADDDEKGSGHRPSNGSWDILPFGTRSHPDSLAAFVKNLKQRGISVVDFKIGQGQGQGQGPATSLNQPLVLNLSFVPGKHDGLAGVGSAKPTGTPPGGAVPGKSPANPISIGQFHIRAAPGAGLSDDGTNDAAGFGWSAFGKPFSGGNRLFEGTLYGKEFTELQLKNAVEYLMRFLLAHSTQDTAPAEAASAASAASVASAATTSATGTVAAASSPSDSAAASHASEGSHFTHSPPPPPPRRRKLILYIKDLNDMLEGGGEHGMIALMTLLRCVQIARTTYQVPVVLVGGSTPSVLESRNLHRSVENYAKLFNKNVVYMADDPEDGSSLGRRDVENLWTDEIMFDSPVDHLTEVFSKVKVPPPAPPLLHLLDPANNPRPSSQSEADPESSARPPQPQPLESNINREEQPLIAWLKSLDVDEKKRILTVNLQNLRFVCSERGIRLREFREHDADLLVDQFVRNNTADAAHASNRATDSSSAVSERSTQHRASSSRSPVTVSKEIDEIFVQLQERVWTAGEMEEWIRIAIGERLAIVDALLSGGLQWDTWREPLDLTSIHLLQALRLYQKDQLYLKVGDRVAASSLDGGDNDGDSDSGSGGAYNTILVDSTAASSEHSEGAHLPRNIKGTITENDEGLEQEERVDGTPVPGAHSPSQTTTHPNDPIPTDGLGASRETESTSQTSKPSGAPGSRPAGSKSIKKLLERQGHKLSTYEKKLLATVVDADTIPVGFKDMVLPAPTKLALQTLVTLPLLQPHHFQNGILGRHSINGVLLFGPPGTGKTMLAKAVAKSGGARFMNVSLSDVFDKYVGEGEKNVRAIFTLARKLAPCVVFLDEVDALFGARRSDGSNSSRREIINEFMSEWDGLNSNNGGVIIMGATNRPFDLDDAILRRMPRRILVDLPTESQREKIIDLHLRGETLTADVSIPELAKRTQFYSGSDLKNLCVAAALSSVKEQVVRGVLEADPADAASSNETAKAPGHDTADVLKRADEIDDWTQFLQTAPSTSGLGKSVKHGSAPVKSNSSPQPSDEQHYPGRTLNLSHFEVAFKEVPPSLTDDMQTLMELKKWNQMYGDGSARKNAKPGWGF